MIILILSAASGVISLVRACSQRVCSLEKIFTSIGLPFRSTEVSNTLATQSVGSSTAETPPLSIVLIYAQILIISCSFGTITDVPLTIESLLPSRVLYSPLGSYLRIKVPSESFKYETSPKRSIAVMSCVRVLSHLKSTV